MQLLMGGVDQLYQDTNRLVSYEKNIAKQMQMKQQFIQKRVTHSFCINHLKYFWHMFSMKRTCEGRPEGSRHYQILRK